MRFFRLIKHSLDLGMPVADGYEPPSLCHDFGIGELAGLAGAAGSAGAATLAPVSLASFGAAAGSAAAASLVPAAAIALPSLGTLGAIANIGGTALSAKSALDQGKYQEELGQAQNEALQQKANQDAAAAQRQQEQTNRQTQFTLSRDQAISAASGGSATDPSVLNVEGQVAQQGDYNALTALYNGQSRAQADQYQGSIDLFQGNRAGQAAPLNAATTLLSGFSNFATNRASLRYYTKIGSAPYGQL
jgi:hypothetical protein